MDRQNLCTSIKTHIYNVYCGYIFHLVKQIHTQTHSINRPNRPELICKRGWLADSGVLFGLLEVPLEEAAGSGVLSTRLISHAFTSMLLLILQLTVTHTHTHTRKYTTLHTHTLTHTATHTYILPSLSKMPFLCLPILLNIQTHTHTHTDVSTAPFTHTQTHTDTHRPHSLKCLACVFIYF